MQATSISQGTKLPPKHSLIVDDNETARRSDAFISKIEVSSTLLATLCNLDSPQT